MEPGSQRQGIPPGPSSRNNISNLGYKTISNDLTGLELEPSGEAFFCKHPNIVLITLPRPLIKLLCDLALIQRYVLVLDLIYPTPSAQEIVAHNCIEVFFLISAEILNACPIS